MDYVEIAKQRRSLTKASEMLLGLVTGIIADQQLHDMEIQLLRTWMANNSEVTTAWPGSVLSGQINAILEDGIVTEAEREHLLKVLQQFAVTDFAATGSATPEVIQLPINDDGQVAFADSLVCLTGEFIAGTRDVCSSLTIGAGATIAGGVTKKLNYLVVGTNVSPHWANTSYGRKIQKAVELQAQGLAISIISERRWLAALGRT